MRPDSPYPDQLRAAREAASAGGPGVGLRVTLVAGVQLDTLLPLLELWLRTAGFDPHLSLTPFDTLEQQVLQPGSALYGSRPDVVVMMPAEAAILSGVHGATDRESVRAAALRAAQNLDALAAQVRDRAQAEVVLALAPSPATRVLGNQDGTDPSGQLYCARALRLALADVEPAAYTLFDLAALAERQGLAHFRDERLWYHARQPFSAAALGVVAHALSQLIAGLRGMNKKVVVVDLDNTLWGGVIGDDGVDGIVIGPNAEAEGEAYLEFQRYLQLLGRSGVMLAVCSKNDPEVARAPFREHPDMALRLEDFSAFVANWKPKVENLRDIARELNIGVDSMVFIDDNPVERDLVRQVIPEITVPELSEDPAEYVEALERGLLFERPRLTSEDLARSHMMAAEVLRRQSQAELDVDSYLGSLELIAQRGTVDAATEPRVTQLINKTNQFNLNGAKLTSPETHAYATAGIARWYRLRDRFGDYGIVSAVVGRSDDGRLVLDNWVVSCRAFQRTLEAFILRDVIEVARAKRCDVVALRFVDTSRNSYACAALREMGFVEAASGWLLRPVSAAPPPTFVTEETPGGPKT